MNKWMKVGFILLCVFGLSGCNSLLKPNKLYSTEFIGKIYNQDKHYFTNRSGSALIFAVAYDKSAGFVKDEGQGWHWVGDTDWVSKDSYNTKMQPFLKFQQWSALPRSEQEPMRIKYNNDAAIKDADIEFNYFIDGSPAFVDLSTANRWALENYLFDRQAYYYSTRDVNKMVEMINTSLAIY